MADSFENEAEAEPTITIKDYLKAVEEEELVWYINPFISSKFLAAVPFIGMKRHSYLPSV